MHNRIENLFSPVLHNTAPLMIHDPFETIFSAFFGRSKPHTGLELYDKRDHYEVRAEFPGFEREELNVTIENGLLSIKGKSKTEQRERSVSKSVVMPDDADSKKIKAELKNGVLRVTIQKTEDSKGREIPIE